MSHPLAHASEPRRARAAKWTRRHPRAMLSAAAVALAVALMLVGATAWRYRQDAIHMAAINHFEDFASHSATVLSTIMVDPQRHQEAGVLAAIKPLQDFGVLDGSGLADLQSPWMTLPQRDRVRDTLLRHVAQVAFAETDRLRPEAAQGPLDDAALRRLDRLIDAADRVRGQHPSRACEYLHAKRAALAGNVVRSDQHRRRAEAMGIEDQSEAYLDAVRLMSNRQWHLAREALTALADDPSIPSGLRWTMLGRSQYNDNKYEDAKISITQSIEHAPKASRLWFMRGLCYQQLSQHARAESDFGRAIDLEPTFAPAWAQRGLARLAQVRGKDEASFTSHEKYQSGIEDYTKSLALAPGNAQVLLMRARAYGHGGQDDLAQRDWEAAMNAENQSAPNLLRRAQARRETQPAQALADLERADKLDPDSRPVLSQMARILYARLHQYDRAMEVLDRLLSVYPNNEAALIDRSVLLARAGRHEEAIIDFKAAMAEPNSNRTLYQAACMQACMGQHVRAVSLLAKAIRAGYPATRASLEDDPDLDAIRHLPGFKAIQRTCYLGDLGERSGDNADGEIL